MELVSMVTKSYAWAKGIDHMRACGQVDLNQDIVGGAAVAITMGGVHDAGGGVHGPGRQGR